MAHVKKHDSGLILKSRAEIPFFVPQPIYLRVISNI